MLNDILKAILVIVLQFVSGSVMYSYLLLKLKKDNPHSIGDGNPGVLNLWKAAGWKYGVTGMILDYLKGILPLLIFMLTGFITNNYAIALAALAGIAGHAFSPFLKFKGGKGITTTFGAWSVMTKWIGPVIFGGILGSLYLFAKSRKRKLTKEEDVSILIIAFIGLLMYMLYNVLKGDYALTILYFGNLGIVLFKHKKELAGITKTRTRRKQS